MITINSFGTAPDGTPAHVYTLANGPVTVRLSDFGRQTMGMSSGAA